MKQQAFTLVELLVVIAIIGMLVGLLLPAVQQAREAARILQCNNHLRQLTLASLNYESQMQAFPSGGWWWKWVGDPDRSGTAQPGSWVYSILPFLELQALHDLPSDGQPEVITTEQKAKTREMILIPIPILMCPSRRPPVTSYAMDNTRWNCDDTPISAKNDYVGCCGSSNMLRSSAASPENFTDAMSLIRKNQWEPVGNGILYATSRVTTGEIRDGLSQTFLAGEKYLDPLRYAPGSFSQICSGDDQGPLHGSDNDNVRAISTLNSWFPFQDRANFNSNAPRNFGSPHAGSLGMAYADGSVHRVSYTMDREVLESYAIRADGGQKVAEVP